MLKTALVSAAFGMLAGAAAAGGLFTPADSLAPGDDWTGFYAGLHYGTGSVEARGPAGRRDTDIDAYGLHLGYQRDFGTHVLGGELDYDRLDGDRDQSADLMRLRARGGMKHGRALPYLSLGLARYSDDSYSDTGLTLGLGVDFRLNETVTLGLDYSRDRIDDVDGSGADLDIDSVRIRASLRF